MHIFCQLRFLFWFVSVQLDFNFFSTNFLCTYFVCWDFVHIVHCVSTLYLYSMSSISCAQMLFVEILCIYGAVVCLLYTAWVQFLFDIFCMLGFCALLHAPKHHLLISRFASMTSKSRLKKAYIMYGFFLLSGLPDFPNTVIHISTYKPT